MNLRSLTIRNFRSLEDVTLAGLDQFNVLIGRNNTGKSSVFQALKFVTHQVFGLGGAVTNSREIVTDHADNRELEVEMTFAPSQEDRETFIEFATARGGAEDRDSQLLLSPFLQKMCFGFRAPAGAPHHMRLDSFRLLAQDGVWATIYKVSLNQSGRWEAQLADVPSILRNLGAIPVTAESIDVGSAKNLQGTSIFEASKFEPTNHMGLEGWIFGSIRNYFSTLFFVSPFRHSSPSMAVMRRDRLSADGSDLAIVLNSLSGGGRSKFTHIEQMLHQAVPEVGVLEPELVPVVTSDKDHRVRVSFQQQRKPDMRVQLQEMGGGVEALLMAATIIATEGSEATLFVDEPETHLHPGAQRFLADQLRQGVRQVFVATHSPAFINVPSPRSIYRVALLDGRTDIRRIKDVDGLAHSLEEIDARNSDVLLSDAVLFVEGPTDVEVFQTWSRTVGESFDQRNLTVLEMGGGAQAARHAPVRSEVLTGISNRVGIPHLFVLDGDERSKAEITSLRAQLGGKLHILARRELENYLLVPEAIFEVLSENYRTSAAVQSKLESADAETIRMAIAVAADELYGVVLLKRIKAEIGGCPKVCSRLPR